MAILTVWCLIAWLPVLGLVRLAPGAGGPPSGPGGGRVGVFGVLARRMGEPPVRRLAVKSAIVGLEVAAAILFLFWLDGSGRRARRARAGADRTRSALPIVFAPPLIVGVGVLAIPWVAGAAADQMPITGPGAGLARTLATLAGWLAPSGDPSLFLAVSVACVLGPVLFACWRPVQPYARTTFAAMDAARLIGASRLRALWLSAESRHHLARTLRTGMVPGRDQPDPGLARFARHRRADRRARRVDPRRRASRSALSRSRSGARNPGAQCGGIDGGLGVRCFTANRRLRALLSARAPGTRHVRM